MKGDSMDSVLMKKATFSEICRVMKHKDGALRECIHSIVKLSLLFFPGLMCKEYATAGAALEAGILNLDVKCVVDEAITSVKTAFNKEQENFTVRSEDAQIAQVLIVFAAYFDSIKMLLPDAFRAIELTNGEKCYLTEKSLSDYESFLSQKATEKIGEDGGKLAHHELIIPNPVEDLDCYLEKLKKFYEFLNSHFLEFTEHLAFEEEMRGHEKDYFYSAMHNIPEIAVDNYKKQYYELSAIFPDFFVWANQREHEAIKRSIDVGFREVSKQFRTIYETFSNSLAQNTLKLLHNNYTAYINKPIVSTSDMPLGEQDIGLPAREACFVPQSFRALVYRKKITLENTDQWISRNEIGHFVANVLRSPELGSKPLLILGDPGAGKTMLCHMLAAKILYHEYHVIILHLRNLQAEETIYRQIEQEIADTIQGGRCTWSDIASANLQKPILLIFDGYDELLQASGKSHSSYLETIAQFQQEAMRIYGVTVRSIVTSRIILIDKAQIPRGSAVIRLDDFDEDRIDRWCAVWNQHNDDYFMNHDLQPFTIDSSSRAWDLAKQPLLLLMLALFDTNGNALHKHQDLSAPRLYNSLIRDFVEREKKKDPEFNRKSLDFQDEDVEQAVERISIAALGMYNRNEFYIRSNQLQEDLRCLSSVDLAKELSDSDRLLGSFFFIHCAESKESVNRTRISYSAYEFLHNTFGEFLTAHYIVMRTYELLADIHDYGKKRRSRSMTMADRREWYVSLCYTPLFKRPVVTQMIEGWAPLYFADQGMGKNDVEEALRSLLDIEVPRILGGEVINTLNDATSDFRSPDSYPQKDSMTLLSVYSNNLMSLSVLLNGGLPLNILEQYDSQAWSKLVHLWKYTFGEQDITAFSKQFEIENWRERVLIKSGNEIKTTWKGNRLRELFEVTAALGEDLEHSILGVLLGDDHTRVLEGLLNQQIRLKARVTLQSFLRDFSYDQQLNSISSEQIAALKRLRNFGIEERDYGSLMCYYLILKQIALPLKGISEEMKALVQPITLFSDYNRTIRWRNCYRLSNLILELLIQIPLDRECYEELYTRIRHSKSFGRGSVNQTLCHTAKLSKYIVNSCGAQQDFEAKKLAGCCFRATLNVFELMCQRSKFIIKEESVLEILRLMSSAMDYGYEEYACRFLSVYAKALEENRFGEGYQVPVEHISLILPVAWLCNSERFKVDKVVIFALLKSIINNETDIVKLFFCDASVVVTLCNLAIHYPEEFAEQIVDGLTDLVLNHSNQLTFGVYRILYKLADTLKHTDLRIALDKMVE